MDELRSYIGEGDESISSVIRIALKELLKRLKDEKGVDNKIRSDAVERLRKWQEDYDSKEEKESKRRSEIVERLRRLGRERDSEEDD